MVCSGIDFYCYHEWITTIAFYKALHIVEAVFFRNPKIKHGQNHVSRESFLKRENKYKNIWKHYRSLWAASMVSRYLEEDGKAYSSFSKYLSSEKVKSEMLDHRLHRLQKTATKFLSQDSVKELNKSA